MKQKYIFDLDQTLLDVDFSKEKDYFKSVLSHDDLEIFMPQISNLLNEYEKKFIRYDVSLLSEYLSKKSKVNITTDIVNGWIECDMDTKIVPGAFEVLEELKRRDKELVVLTNWFSKTQRDKLEKSGLGMYFDKVYGGEEFLKPNRQAYINACGYTPLELCVMIGDTYEKDFEGARIIGMDAIYFDRDGLNTKKNESIRTLTKVLERY